MLANPLTESLVAEWHPIKNLPLQASDVSNGSNKKVWWLGLCGHEWQSVVSNRAGARKTGCPVCKGKQILIGFNDLMTTHPTIASQWHPINNLPVTVDQISAGSSKKVWWLGKCSHEWQARVSSRCGDNQNCPYCSNQAILIGFNDLATTHPEHAAQWHPQKNLPLTPQDLNAGSNKKVWWLGKCGHEWQARIYSFTNSNSTGCKTCQRHITVIGETDLKTTHPDLVKEWHPTKNGDLVPEMFVSGSGKRIWWTCARGHEWATAIANRAKTQTGCPRCTANNVPIISGTNDFHTLQPILATEWHPVLNGGDLPSNFTANSGRKIWWLCSKSHHWEARISDRTRTDNPTGCPTCAAGISISKAEQKIADFLTSQGFAIKQSARSVLKGMELDIYIPSKNMAVEYNGLYWHSEKAGKDKKYHHAKWAAAKAAGIQLIQIWEDEWNTNPEQIKAMLLHKLGVSAAPKIYARNTHIKVLRKKEIEEFLNLHHIQGFSSGSYYLGLVDKNTDVLVSVIVLRKEPNNTLNIIRYATSNNVVGGFTKLLSYAEKFYMPDRFITFSDHCVSDGGLYKNNGFIADKELAPDYRYVIKGVRQHKFGYRLKRFRNDPNLQWEEGKTERELADLNRIPRIWDAGKTRWVKNVKLI